MNTVPPTLNPQSAEVLGAPALRFQVATLEGFKTMPAGAELDAIEAAYLEEGFAGVEAVPSSGDDRAWAVSVFATHSPYRD